MNLPRFIFAIVIGLFASHSTHGQSGNVVVWQDFLEGPWDISAASFPKPAGLTNVTAIAAGNLHSLALRENGTVVAWGNNSFGQTNVPAELTNVWKIAAGGNHSFALLTNGTVVGWGDLTAPQLTNIIAVATGTNHALALTGTGTVVAWGSNDQGQIDVPPNLTNAIAIAAGGDGSLALRSDKTIVGWGATHIASVPAGLTNVIAITASSTHAVALLENGTTPAWGITSGAQYFPTAVSSAAVVAAKYYSLVLKADTTVRAFPTLIYTDVMFPPPPVGLTNVIAIAAGDRHLMAITLMPAIIREPKNLILYDHGDNSLEVLVDSAAPVSYQWYVGPRLSVGESGDIYPISGTTNAICVITNSMTQATNYCVLVRNEYGSVLSRLASVLMPPRFLQTGISNGTFFVEAVIPEGTYYNLEVSTNLQTWRGTGDLRRAYDEYLTFRHERNTSNQAKEYFRLRSYP